MLPWMLGHIYMDGDLVRRWKDFAATQNPASVARTRLPVHASTAVEDVLVTDARHHDPVGGTRPRPE